MDLKIYVFSDIRTSELVYQLLKRQRSWKP